MYFKENIKHFLNGTSFDSALKVELDGADQLTYKRIEILEQLCKGKNIIHLGCADHINLIDEKMQNNQWLHQRLCNVSSKCIGIDINNEAIHYLTQKYKIEDLYNGDIMQMDLTFLKDKTYDYIVLGEIIEHVPNPVDFLAGINKRLKGHVRSIIITAPNPWNRSMLKALKSNVELINSDHKYWFTPYTLSKVLTEAGFEVKELLFGFSSFPKYNFLKSYYRKKHYFQSESIIAVAEL